jgi:hypothetical protein
MAVDKLPGALAKESSEYFSEQLVKKILPNFWTNDPKGMLDQATMVKEGKLTRSFAYLKDFVKEREH